MMKGTSCPLYIHLSERESQVLLVHLPVSTLIPARECGFTLRNKGENGRTRAVSAALGIQLCEFMWLKKFNLIRSDLSIRKSVNREISLVM